MALTKIRSMRMVKVGFEMCRYEPFARSLKLGNGPNKRQAQKTDLFAKLYLWGSGSKAPRLLVENLTN